MSIMTFLGYSLVSLLVIVAVKFVFQVYELLQLPKGGLANTGIWMVVVYLAYKQINFGYSIAAALASGIIVMFLGGGMIVLGCVSVVIGVLVAMIS